MSRNFLYLPSEAAPAIRKLSIEQWAKWQSARAKNGVTWGPDELPGKSHPDILEEYSKLPAHIQDFALALTYGRVMIFAKLPHEDLQTLILCAKNGEKIPSTLIEKIAESFHQSWFLLRQSLNLSGHSGDKPWEEESETEKDNDRKLIHGWAELLYACSISTEEEFAGLMRFLMQSKG